MSQEDKVLFPLLLKRCARLVDHRIDNLLKRHQIARSQYRVMYYVARYGEPTQKELIGILEVQGPTLTLIVDVLVQKGWLTRVNDVKDRRIKRLRLTPKGKRLFERVPDPVKELDDLIKQGVSSEELAAAEILLEKIMRTLQ